MKTVLRKLTATRFLLTIIKSLKWLGYYLRYSATLSRTYVPEHSRAWILKESHTLEKGLSFKDVRPHFGAEKRRKLLEEVERSQSRGHNENPRAIAAGVLLDYLDWHRRSGAMNDEMQMLNQVVQAFGELPTRKGGTVPYRHDYTSEETDTYRKIVLERRSVRNFRPDRIPTDLIADAVAIANHSPSVCNRQPWAVALVQEPSMVRAMLDLQNGNSGFDSGIGNIIVVLADVRGFLDEYEIFEPFVDAGIFSNALVNALNAFNIGSCCLNLCVSHHKSISVARALKLEGGLFPIMMIACGYPDINTHVAVSARLDATLIFR